MTQVSSTTLAGFPAIRTAGTSDRPPLLFIHGAFATHQPFAGWMEALARIGWGGVAVARRGMVGGGTAASVADVTIADYVDDTLRAIDALGEPPIVVGHSLGGLIAQKIAELGKCRAAVLVAPAPAGMLTAQPGALPAFLPMFPNILMGRPIRPSCNTCETIALNCIPPQERTRIHDALVHESGKVYREMIFGTFRVDAGKVQCPVLVVGGRQDRIVSIGLMQGTAKRYGAELKLYDGHGHWLLEEPGYETIVADVGAWLERVVARDAAPLRATGS
jgi:pimeloyl-ACP methyl ester carboxylesterase